MPLASAAKMNRLTVSPAVPVSVEAAGQVNFEFEANRMSQEKSRHTAIVDRIEGFALAAVDATANVAISSLDQTQRVLDQTELLAKRLVQIKQRVEHFGDSSRQVFKQQALEICRDGAEIASELVHQAGQVARTAVNEFRDVGQNAETLLKDLLEPALELPNPFRQKASRKKAKEPTIIPISIQDN